LFKKYLKQPLATLWAAIIVIRVVLDDMLLGRPDAGSWFDLISVLVALAVSVAEFYIFFRAYRAYSKSIVRIEVRTFGIVGKILLPLLFFCLPYGLWTSRRMIVELAVSTRSGRWIDIAGLATACGLNLVLSGYIAHSMLALRSQSKQAA